MKYCIRCGEKKKSYNGKYCRKCFQLGERNPCKSHSKKIREKISKSMKGINAGEKNPYWKGGKTKDGHGYIYIRNFNHPYTTKRGYIKRSRLIMEKILNRYLLPEEIIHHKNEIKNDDRPENLQLFSSKGKHSAFHKRRNKWQTNMHGQTGKW